MLALMVDQITKKQKLMHGVLIVKQNVSFEFLKKKRINQAIIWIRQTKYMKVLHPEEAIKELGLKEQQIKFTSELDINGPGYVMTSPADFEKMLDNIKELIQK
jgi:hypothetical protein